MLRSFSSRFGEVTVIGNSAGTRRAASRSTMRQSASSSASSTTDSNAASVHGLLVSGGTASRIRLGARASGAERFAVTAAVPLGLGTTSVHASSSTPVTAPPASSPTMTTLSGGPAPPGTATDHACTDAAPTVAVRRRGRLPPRMTGRWRRVVPQGASPRLAAAGRTCGVPSQRASTPAPGPASWCRQWYGCPAVADRAILRRRRGAEKCPPDRIGDRYVAATDSGGARGCRNRLPIPQAFSTSALRRLLGDPAVAARPEVSATEPSCARARKVSAVNGLRPASACCQAAA